MKQFAFDTLVGTVSKSANKEKLRKILFIEYNKLHTRHTLTKNFTIQRYLYSQ